MARRNRRPAQQPVRALGGADARRESFGGADYLVRPVTGAAAVKAYRCPGCQQLILAGRPHVVAWPDGVGGADDRRHWHTACWAARERR